MNSGPIDILIVAPLPEECAAVLALLPGYHTPGPSTSDRYLYYEAQLPLDRNFPNAMYSVVVVSLPEMGTSQSALTTTHAIDRWTPRCVILTGIAGGIEANGARVGDLIIADQIFDYSLQKTKPGKRETRPRGYPCDTSLIEHAKAFSDWTHLLTGKIDRTAIPTLHVGPVASGNEVVASPQRLKALLALHPKLIGVEMEAGGCVKAVHHSASKPSFFMLRCVSDLADTAKSSASVSGTRHYVCSLAASALISFLRTGPLTPLTPYELLPDDHSVHVTSLNIYDRLGYKCLPRPPGTPRRYSFAINRIEQGIGDIVCLVACMQDYPSREALQAFSDTIHEHERTNATTTRGIVVLPPEHAIASSDLERPLLNVSLYSLQSLEHLVFSSPRLYRDYVTQYEETSIFMVYVPLSADVHPGSKPGGDSVSDIETHIMQWMDEANGGFYAVLADFGAGKSTLIDRLRYSLCRKALAEGVTQTPLVVRLKDFKESGSLDSLIHRSLKRDFRQDVSLPAFWSAVASGRMRLLLDGFDEMNPGANSEQRLKDMLSLSDLLLSPSCAVLTCRPEAFVSHDEMEAALTAAGAEGFRTLDSNSGSPFRKNKSSATASKKRAEALKGISARLQQRGEEGAHTNLVSPTRHGHIAKLRLFGDAQIEMYLSRHSTSLQEKFGWSVPDALQWMQDVYDISDLVTRPILLEMIVDTILSGNIDIADRSTVIGPYDLYSLWTSEKLRREGAYKNRDTVSIDGRHQLAEATAIAMYEQSILDMSHMEVHAVVVNHTDRFSQYSNGERVLTVEDVVNDVRMCTFLKLDGNNRFRFAHKSLMEYYLARHIGRCAGEGARTPLLNGRVPKEVLYFLASYCAQHDIAWVRLQDWYHGIGASQRAESVFCRNVASTLFGTPSVLSKLSLAKCEISDVDAIGSTLIGPRLDAIVMSNVNMRRVTVEECDIAITESRNVNMSECDFRRGRFTWVVSDGTIRETVFRGIHVAIRVASAAASCKISMSQCKVSDARLEIQGRALQKGRLEVAIEGLMLDDCREARFEVADCSSVVVNGCAEVFVSECDFVDSTLKRVGRSSVVKSMLTRVAVHESDITLGPEVRARDTILHKSTCSLLNIDYDQGTVQFCATVHVTGGSVTSTTFEECSRVVLEKCRCVNLSLIRSQVDVDDGVTLNDSRFLECRSVCKGNRTIRRSTWAGGACDALQACVFIDCTLSEGVHIAVQHTRFETCKFASVVIVGRVTEQEDYIFHVAGGAVSGRLQLQAKGHLEDVGVNRAATVELSYGSAMLRCEVSGTVSADGANMTKCKCKDADIKLVNGSFTKGNEYRGCSVSLMHSVTVEGEFDGTERTCVIIASEGTVDQAVIKGRVSIRGEHLIVKETQFRKASVDIGSRVTVNACRFEQSDVIFGSVRGNSRLDKCAFVETSVRNGDVRRSGGLELVGCRYERCMLWLIPVGDVVDIEQFEGSRGVLLLDSGAESRSSSAVVRFGTGLYGISVPQSVTDESPEEVCNKLKQVQKERCDEVQVQIKEVRSNLVASEKACEKVSVELEEMQKRRRLDATATESEREAWRRDEQVFREKLSELVKAKELVSGELKRLTGELEREQIDFSEVLLLLRSVE